MTVTGCFWNIPKTFLSVSERSLMVSDRKSSRSAAQDLMEVMTGMGFTREFAEIISASLISDKARVRMTSYMLQFRPVRMEDVADEMLSINAQFESWKRKKIAEYYNSKYNILLRDGLDPDGEDEYLEE